MRWIFMAAGLIARLASGQERPEFEVASVKPAVKEDRGPAGLPEAVGQRMRFKGGPGTADPGRISYEGVSLKALLARAYDVKPGQVSGPSWLGSERYTIEAKVPPGTDAARLRLMLQALLVERFQMGVHKETKETAVYRLKVAKNGPKLKPAEELPHYENDEDRKAAMEKGARANLDRMLATRQENDRLGIRTPSRNFGLARATMEKFAEVLSTHLDRPVKDLTGVEGEYSFHLSWTPEGSMHPEDAGLSIFIAIQEQLGLRLEAGNELLELVIVDKAERVPTSN